MPEIMKELNMSTYLNITISVNTAEDLAKMMPNIQTLIGCAGNDVKVSIGDATSTTESTPESKTTKPKAKPKAKPKTEAASPEKMSERSAEDKELVKEFRKLFGETKTKHKSEVFAAQCIENAGFTRGSNDLATFLASVTIDKIPEIMAAMKLGPVDTEGHFEKPEEVISDEGATSEAAKSAVKALSESLGGDFKEARAAMKAVGAASLASIDDLSPADCKKLIDECLSRML